VRYPGAGAEAETEAGDDIMESNGIESDEMEWNGMEKDFNLME
jgi:hypothetical protein